MTRSGRPPLPTPQKVPVSFRLSRFHYDALQRWLGIYNTVNQTDAVTTALEKLPGFTRLLREEKEAYANTQNQANQEISDFTLKVRQDTGTERHR